MRITTITIICLFLVLLSTGSSSFQLPSKDWLSPGITLNELASLSYQINSRLWVYIEQPEWFALGRAFYDNQTPTLYGIALFRKDRTLIWSTSKPYHSNFYSLPLDFRVQCVPPSILNEDYPVTITYLQQKYGDFFDVLGDVTLRPCYLLSDGRILYYELLTTYSNIPDINENDQVRPLRIEVPRSNHYISP